MSDLPQHIAIIMDGNGRWATRQNRPRTFGHKEGLEAAKRVVKRAADIGIPWISLYTFSTENWKRAEEEVGFLMNMIKTHLRAELAFYAENGIRVMHMGDLAGLPSEIASEITDIAQATAHFARTTVVLAINYGGRDEIIRAIKKLPVDMREQLTEATFPHYFDIPELPPVDLLIRTSGEKRISNFMIWQSAYAEYYLTEDLWPDWDGKNLDDAIQYYRNRDRRFGGVK
ncbi:MAG: di-trans,poly-cis-decaprenylcistransferase [Spirochaetales bacterium]|nr:di-trans,poly-cis-decaprenylcistransferase [Spirochaetales bacterium]